MRRRTFLRSSSVALPAAALGLTTAGSAHADVRPTGSIAYPFSMIQVPASSAPWTLEVHRAALLVHDMQHYFVKAYAPQADPIGTVLKNIKSLLDTAHAHQMPVYYSAQPGGMTKEQRGLFGQLYGPGMPDDDAERAIVDPLAPTAADAVLTKWKYSEFFRSDLLEILHDANRDQLILVGVYAFPESPQPLPTRFRTTSRHSSSPMPWRTIRLPDTTRRSPGARNEPPES